jgi:hypothetical protein
LVSLAELGADVLSPRASERRATDPNSDGAASAEWLKRAVACDPATLEAARGPSTDNIERSGLDMRVHTIVRLAAFVAGGEPGTAYVEDVVSALGHGVTLDEIVGVLVTLLPTVGPARVTGFAAATLEASSA